MKIKKLFCLLTTFVMVVSVFASNAFSYYYDGIYDVYVNARKAKVGNFTYIIKDYAQYGSVYISNVATVVDIPNIQKVEIPEKVTYAGIEFTVTDLSLDEELPFAYNNVEEIVLPETIYNISHFYGFTSLKKMNLPKNALLDREHDIQNGNLVYSNKGFNDSVHFYYFENCPNLKLSVDPNNPYYSYKNDLLLSKDGKTVYMSFNQSTDLIIPDGVEEILDYGGIGFGHVQYVQLPDTLKNLSGTWKSLKNIRLPNNLISLSGCFYGNKSITKIILPNSLKKIGGFTFYKSKLSMISIPNSVTEIGDKAFAGSSIMSVKFGKNLTTIGQGAFSNCKKLSKRITIKSVSKIENNAFRNCKSLREVNILSNNVQYIRYYAFQNCKQLRSITINGVNKIDSSAFDNCKKLSKITIKNKKKAPKISTGGFKNTKKGIKFVVKNKKVAKQLKKQLSKKKIKKNLKNAKILVGKKTLYKV